MNLAKMNKAWAAGIAQLVVQLLAPFIEITPWIEQGIGVAITALVVYLVPNSTKNDTSKVSALLPVALLVGAAMTVTACSSMFQDTGDPEADAFANAVKRAGIACDSYAASLNVLAMAADMGYLSEGQMGTVDSVVATVGPTCEAQTPPTNILDLVPLIERGAFQLFDMREGLSDGSGASYYGGDGSGQAISGLRVTGQGYDPGRSASGVGEDRGQQYAGPPGVGAGTERRLT